MDADTRRCIESISSKLDDIVTRAGETSKALASLEQSVRAVSESVDHLNEHVHGSNQLRDRMRASEVKVEQLETYSEKWDRRVWAAIITAGVSVVGCFAQIALSLLRS